MTVKQIAEVTGKDERTVQRWVKKTSDKMSSINDKMSSSSPMKPADYDFEETCLIIESGMGKNAAGVFRANADRQLPTVSDSDLDRLFKTAMVTLTTMVESLNSRITRIETQQEEKKALLPAPGKSPRAELSQVVRQLAHAKYDDNFNTAWHFLYKELLYRCHINVVTRAKNEGLRPIDIIENENLLDTAVSIIVEYIGAAV